MTNLFDTERMSASTTRISTNLEDLWRGQFFAEQGQTPAGIMSDMQRESGFREIASTVRFSGGLYDPAIIRFYEDVILELQKQVVRYRALWEAATKAAHEEAEDMYVPQQTVPLSKEVAEKLRRSTKPGLRASVE
jgi:hypothetical protein